jgi:prepilin-type N-terminal cleavage/methylation domain-containing protein
MKSHPPRGFTLVELLVVIGIIAVLISILMPTLARVRKQAMRIACAANLRSNAQAVLMYANENAGKIPAFDRTRTGAPVASPHHFYIAYAGPNVATNAAPGTLIPYNLGTLHASRHMPDPRVFYCPAMLHKEDIGDVNFYPAPYGSALSSAGGVVRTSFYLNPHTFTNPAGKRENRYTKLRELGSSRALVTDVLRSGMSGTLVISTGIAIAHDVGWNVVYSDGRVEFRIQDEVVRKVKAAESWENGSLADWDRFEVALTLLEAGN